VDLACSRWVHVDPDESRRIPWIVWMISGLIKVVVAKPQAGF
jgi:hypothetical protein